MAEKRNKKERQGYNPQRDIEAEQEEITPSPEVESIEKEKPAAGPGAGAAAMGTMGGPVSAFAGAVVGALAVGVIDLDVAVRIDPAAEDAYWRENYRSRPYARQDLAYEDYQPAYRFGWESRARNYDKPFEPIAEDLRRDWENIRNPSGLEWHEALPAVHDAWDRITSRATSQTAFFEEALWRTHYQNSPYYSEDVSFEEYAPAYRYGAECWRRQPDRSFEEAEPELRGGWETLKERSRLGWDKVHHAVHDVWERMTRRSAEGERAGSTPRKREGTQGEGI